jgi:hypothetical protein
VTALESPDGSLTADVPAERPLVLLDVDGPLNPYAAKSTRRPLGYDTYRLAPQGWSERRPLRVWLKSTHGDLLLALAELTDAELVWCTTWNDEANTLIGPKIGLPELPTIVVDAHHRHWKFPAVLEYAGATRPLLWFDDDFRLFPEAVRWFHRRRHVDARTKLFYVRPERGLTYEDVDAARRWLNEEDK